MHILVPVSTTQALDHPLQVDSSSQPIITHPVLDPGDDYALEAALQIGGTITALAVGDAQQETGLRSALAMGIESAIRVDTIIHSGDHRGRARAIAAAMPQLEAIDLVIAGPGECHPGVMLLARELNWSLVAGVNAIHSLDPAGATVRLSRHRGNYDQALTASCPAALIVRQGINSPRYPTFNAQQTARSAAIRIITYDVDSLIPITYDTPPEYNGCQMIEGSTPEEKAANLINALKQERII